jgi:DinB family protein
MNEGLELPIERCPACGFDAETWSDEAAIEAIAVLPARRAQALAGLTDGQLGRRPIADMWSVAEYTDHVREVLFGMRFLLDSAQREPGIDLGEAPEPLFDPAPHRIDIDAVLTELNREAGALSDRLRGLAKDHWRRRLIGPKDG